MARIHVIGAGLAGLSAAVRLTAEGRAVVVYEAAAHAGGRCRSMHDEVLGCTIDNGNHLMLSGNHATMAYLDRIGARDTLLSPNEAVFPFVDLASGEHWQVRPNRGRIPWWIFVPSRRVPGTNPGDYLAALRLGRGDPMATVAACLDRGSLLYQKFWEPLAVSVLNTAATEGAARLLWPVVVEIFGRGGAAARPCIARDGLSASLVDPALAYLSAGGAEIRFGRRLRSVVTAGGRVTALDFGRTEEAVGDGDKVVLALPPTTTAALLPGTPAPRDSRPIVNAHFRLDRPPDMAENLPFLGMIGGAAHWLFVRGQVVSVTVSAAVDLAPLPAEAIAARLWTDVARALTMQAAPLPPWRVVKEKRATFAQTPDSMALRPGPGTALANLVLAGDWTATGLPATIESAVRSGVAAADAVTRP